MVKTCTISIRIPKVNSNRFHFALKTAALASGSYYIGEYLLRVIQNEEKFKQAYKDKGKTI